MPQLLTVDVLDVSVRERSSVVGNGGGFTYNGYGVTFPVRIRTHHQKFVDVWVRLPDGSENSLDFSGIELPVRATHRLALLILDNSVWAIRNFTSNRTVWLVTPESLEGPTYRPGFGGFIGCWFLIFFISEMIVQLSRSSGPSAQDFPLTSLMIGLCVCPHLLGLRSMHKNRGRSQRIANYRAKLNTASEQLAMSASGGELPTKK